MKTYMPPPGDPQIAENLKQLSRLKFGRDRAIVDADVKERSKLDEIGGGGGEGIAPDSFI